MVLHAGCFTPLGVARKLGQDQTGPPCGRVPPLPLAWEAVVLDEQGLDMLSQQLVMLHAPVPQDAGGELVVRVAGPAQHHLHHLLAGPGGKSGVRAGAPGSHS